MTRSIRYGSLWYWIHDTRHRLKFVLSGDCGHACDWCHPFGWVPEDGCPVHDVGQEKQPIKLWVSTPAGECLVGEVKLWPKP